MYKHLKGQNVLQIIHYKAAALQQQQCREIQFLSKYVLQWEHIWEMPFILHVPVKNVIISHYILITKLFDALNDMFSIIVSGL